MGYGVGIVGLCIHKIPCILGSGAGVVGGCIDMLMLLGYDHMLIQRGSDGFVGGCIGMLIRGGGSSVVRRTAVARIDIFKLADYHIKNSQKAPHGPSKAPDRFAKSVSHII